ncbi:hypothetical protein GCM10011289_02340 [Paludibacterium paludis]|uniref:Uncharacterized protein n=1 Tax=Paludibacterium paludis TaxID=1225769 RepID=A0A918NX51_9NEIS|nr:hypothetical protein GCM10011289_02340 [Paludibacterium paludis]
MLAAIGRPFSGGLLRLARSSLTHEHENYLHHYKPNLDLVESNKLNLSKPVKMRGVTANQKE